MPASLPQFGNLSGIEDAHEEARRVLQELLNALDTDEIYTVIEYVDALVADGPTPDESSPKQDARIHSLVDIARTLNEDLLEQLLFFAEDAQDTMRKLDDS